MHAADLEEVTTLIQENKFLGKEQQRVSTLNFLRYSDTENGFQFNIIKECLPDVKNAYLNSISARIAANNNKLRDLGVKV